MNLFAPLQRSLGELGYTDPTPIQSKTIPLVIEGADILGCAQTGTGKTAAFALPILDYLGRERPELFPRQPLALVLAPTRELAIQIDESFRAYAKHIPLEQAVVYGGVGQRQQVRALREGVDVLVATPGRLVDLIDQGHVDLSGVEVFVLDEADRMLDMGFLPALKRILAKLPEERQSLFFSATLPKPIRKLSEKLLFNPVTVNVTPKKSTSVARIKQSVRYVERNNKVKLLTKVLRSDAADQTIVFTRTKHGANGLVKKLSRVGVEAVAIHGNKTQNARQRSLEAFRQGRVNVLVATDVAARGIDIDGVTHVINYDMPVDPESYVHRVGRTGRAGADGIAISFCTADELDHLRAIEKLLGKKLFVENPESSFTTNDKLKQSSNEGNKSPRRPKREGRKTEGQKPEGQKRGGGKGRQTPSSQPRSRRANRRRKPTGGSRHGNRRRQSSAV